MKPQPERPSRPLFPLTIAGGILLLGSFAVSIASNSLDSVAFWAGVAGAVLLVVGLTVKSRP